MRRRDKFTGLDPWPHRRPLEIVIERSPEGVFAISRTDGRRLLKIPGRLVINEKVVRETLFEYDETERST